MTHPSPYPDIERRVAAGDLDGAIARCGEVLAGRPEDPEAHLWVGRIAVKLGARDVAERHLRRSLATCPDGEAATAELADLLAAAHRLGEAERMLGRAVERQPLSVALLLRLGRVRHAAMRFAAAAEALERAAAIAPGDAEVAFALGRALAEIGTRRDDAARVQRRAAELAGFAGEYVWSAVNWHLINDEPAVAAGYIRDLIARRGADDPDPAPQFTLGRLLTTLGDAAEGERQLAAALAKCGHLVPAPGLSRADIAAYEARVLHAQGNRDAAADMFRACADGIAPADFTYDPSVYPPDMPARLARLRAIVAERDVAVLCHGPSLAALEPLAERLRRADICWVSLNRFRTVERHILEAIGHRLEIVIGTSPTETAGYIDHIADFLARSDANAFIASRAALALLPDAEALETRFAEKLLYFEMRSGRLATPENPLHFLPGNTLSVLLPYLQIAAPRRIFLFGADGGAPAGAAATHYRMDSPEFTSGGAVDRDQLRSRLLQDTRQFNDIADVQTLCLTGLFGVMPPPVLNCTLTSLYAPYPRITVEEGVALLAG